MATRSGTNARSSSRLAGGGACGRADTQDWRVEVVHRRLLHARRYLRPKAALHDGLVGHRQPVGLAHGLNNRVDVQWRKAA